MAARQTLARLLLAALPLCAGDAPVDPAPTPAPAAAESQATGQDAAQEEEKAEAGRWRFRLRFSKQPSFRIRRVIRVDFRVKMQTDFRGYDEELDARELFDFNRRRIGIQGTFLRHFEFEVERELREVANPWRDVFVNFNYLRRFQIRGGRFKIPFSLDQLTPPSDLDFVYRSRIADQLAPGRDLGIVAHGRLFQRDLRYEFGIFREDGDIARLEDDTSGGERTFAGRLTGTPFRRLPAPFKRLELGGAFASSTVPVGLKGLRIRTASRDVIFPRIFVQGHRLRIGTDFDWNWGPVGLRGEFIHVSQERLGQGLRGNDIPNLVSRGWYLGGTWVVTGEKKSGGVNPKKEFPWKGIGEVELAARYEAIRFGSAEHPGRPSRTPRAADILGNSDRLWTFGVNWYINRYVKVQVNAIRESIEDKLHPERTPVLGRGLFWMRVARIQFVM